ncbi:hypothetical protein IC620_05565 [Hazenella sp. IB182357]|uniref:Uncharacterized protein n=1 Tax=Polycladospora coralii TaxID=2771432 RepID=A0A926NAT2_9BACL|nr:hypothetical protein [Polycladospora coralii]MBD1371825.1 hypothetical protein [Polycladospora coralii]MBS7529286.1 hypothetical protein [Polycladospora coralii]
MQLNEREQKRRKNEVKVGYELDASYADEPVTESIREAYQQIGTSYNESDEEA